MTNVTQRERLNAGRSRIGSDEGDVASVTPRRGFLRYGILLLSGIALMTAGGETNGVETLSVELAPALPWNRGAPHINAPARFGASAWKRFSYTFPVRGSRDGMVYELKGQLPVGVTFDAAKARLEGFGAAGEYPLVFRAKNAEGCDERPFTLVIGPGKLAQTPSLGWCSWHAFAGKVSQELVIEAAHIMATNGMAARGYSFVNIDAGWAEYLPDGTSPRREEALRTNRRFPDMKALTDEIHGLGLKCGIYSSPMTRTWGGDNEMPKNGGRAWAYPGSTGVPVDRSYHCNAVPFGVKVGGIGSRHCEGVDARQWADWGFDFLKYDWPDTRADLCQMMRDALDATGRDFVFQCCTGCQFKEAEKYRGMGQLLRGYTDTLAAWYSDKPHAKARSLKILSRNAPREWPEKIGPGMWYDLDMLAIGRTYHNRKNELTPDEQVFHFVYWAFFPSPLFVSTDLRNFDGYLLDLVCNEELLAINQDELGRGARFEDRADELRIARRELADGRRAVALFNYADVEVGVSAREVGAGRVRDILSCRDLDITKGIRLAPHATRVFTFRPDGAEPADDVDPFIGTSWNAHLYPGPKWPNGAIMPGPDTGRFGWGYTSGYRYEDKTVWGFSQTRMSGAGSGEMLDVLVQPFAGDVQDVPRYGIPGRIDKATERATPGYYAVTYTNFAIRAEVTCSPYVAYYRFTYQHGCRGKVLVDLDWGIPPWFNDARDKDPANRTEQATSEVVGDREIRGHNVTSARVRHRDVFFDVVFSRPFKSATPLTPRRKDEIAKRYVVDFGALMPGETVLAKVAVTATDLAGACGNVARETGFDFDARRAQCRAAWNERLSRAEAEGDARQRKIFATALYHASLEPTLFMDSDGRFRGTDLKIHAFADVGHKRYTMFPLWDLMRASLPLYELLMPEQARDFARTFMDEYREIGRLPNGIIWGREVGNMMADHSVPFLVDMALGGLLDIDRELLFKAVDEKLMNRNGNYRKFDYDKVGYFPIDAVGSPCSRTLEYCLDDACAARLARTLGKTEKAAFYDRRARFYRNLWDPTTRMFRARYEDGRWRTPFDPLKYGAGGGDRNFDYTESCGLNYKWHVMQDPYGLIELLGGPEAFVRDLDQLFVCDAGWKKRRRDGDCTGLIGEYAQGNEPQHHVAYFYTLAGRPDRAAEVIREVCERYYTDTPRGICGNDDLGQMSAWYVFSAMGFYPFNPCGGEYVLGAPQVPAVTLRLSNGKTFRVEARNLSRKNKYVRQVLLNGQPHRSPVIRRTDILKGGSLVFQMSDFSR